MIKIYGSPKSSAGRCFWCLEEVEAAYEHKTINFREQEHKSEAYLKINPNGKVPSLVDDDFVIWESMGINFYLANKYRPQLLGTTPQENGLVHQWSIWSIADLQPPIIDVFIQLVFVPEAKRSQTVIDKALSKLPAMMKTLDDGLKGNKYLLGEEFSLADLNVSSVVGVCKEINFDLKEYTNITTWLETISKRPAFNRYQELTKD